MSRWLKNFEFQCTKENKQDEKRKKKFRKMKWNSKTEPADFQKTSEMEF